MTQPALLSKQGAWDRPVCEAVFLRLLGECVVPADRARMLAARSPGSGDWLHAMPLANIGLRMDDAAISVAVSLRLGSPMACPYVLMWCTRPGGWAPRPVLFEECWQAVASCQCKRHNLSFTSHGRGCFSKGAHRFGGGDRCNFAPRWSDATPLGKRETLDMGFHLPRHLSPVASFFNKRDGRGSGGSG